MAEKVGEIFYEVSMDTAGLIQGQRAADKALKTTEKSVVDYGKSTEKLNTSLTEVAKATRIHVTALQLTNIAMRESAKVSAEAAATSQKLGAAVKGSGAEIDKQTISAKQLAAATRGLPAQFTDIFTSLASGQNPLTVFLQQGGQIKDMFGGAGAAARALGTYVLGLISPLTALAAATGAAFVGFLRGSQEMQDFQRTLALTGSASGVTADQLNTLAQRLDGVAGVTRGQAAEALVVLAQLGIKGSESLGRLTEAALRLETAGGPSVAETAKAFKELEKSPLAASLKLNESVNFLTSSLYLQIKALEQQGRLTEAARLAQNGYADAIMTRTPAITESLGLVERAWRAVKDAAREGWDSLLNIGRTQTPEQALEGTRQRIADLQRQLAGGGFATTGGGAATGRGLGQRERAQKEELLAALQEQVRAYDRAQLAAQAVAKTESDRLGTVRAMAEFDKTGEKFLSERARMEREITQARELGKQAGLSQVAIEERIAAIRKSYKSKLPEEKFDSAGYLATLEKTTVEGVAKIDAIEREALRKNQVLLEEGKISRQQAADAVTLIERNAAQERMDILLQKGEERRAYIEQQGLLEAEQAKRKEEERNRGQDFARDIITQDDPVARLQLELQRKSELLDQYAAQDQEHALLYAQAKVDLEEDTAKRIQEIRQQQLLSQMATFDSLVSAIGTFAGKQSGIYKTMFAASKAFAIAQSVISISSGVAQALNAPFPLNLAQAAAVASQGATLLSAIKGSNYGGGRQFGGPVSAGSLYRVNETGRPEMYTASNGSQYMLPTKAGKVTPAGETGGVQWTVIVNEAPPGTTVSVNQEARIVEIAVAQAEANFVDQISSNSGPQWSALRSASNVQGRL